MGVFRQKKKAVSGGTQFRAPAYGQTCNHTPPTTKCMRHVGYMVADRTVAPPTHHFLLEAVLNIEVPASSRNDMMLLKLVSGWPSFANSASTLAQSAGVKR